MHYEAKLCILCIVSGFRNKKAPFLFLLFFTFLYSFRQIFTCLKTCLWNPGTYRHNDYTEQLRKTNSLPISFTIALHDMCFLNRVLTDQFDFNLYRYINFTFAAKDLRNSSRPKLSTTQNCRLFFTEQFFFYRVCRYANMISANNIADIFSSPEIFKAKLKIYLKNRIDMFNLNNSCSMLLCCHCINCRS